MPLLRRRAGDEEGVVLVTVLLITFVLFLLVAGTLAYAIGSQSISRRDQDWNAALTAAEAGFDDYLYRLNQNDQYYLYGATAPVFDCGSANQPALSTPPDGNTAFSSWTAVPGSTTGATFQYRIDTSCLATYGAINVWSSGKSGTTVRTIMATFRRRAFIDYLYFTDYETKDPASYDSTDYYTPTDAQTHCAMHYYEGRSSHCTDINFVTGDVVNGPLHSNDAILICGSPTFNGNVSTSWQGSGSPVRRWRAGSCTNNPSFSRAGDPKYADPLTMPPSDLSVKTQADATLGGTGCLFTGPTSITLNAAGTMTVVSPFTKSGAAPNNCAGGTLASPVTEALPTNGVIYVQNVPSTSTDPNYAASCITSTQLSAGSSTSTATVQHPLGYPEKNDITTYGCMSGDVFLKGTLKGRLTIAADNNIDIVGNVTYQSGTGGSDLLGLVANNYVEIYHPVDLQTSSTSQSWCDGSYIEYPNNSGNYYCNLKLPGGTTALENPTVYAGILAVNHSFRVQNYPYGQDNPLGSINVIGAIAQRYRGIVGLMGTSGYLKNYSYDQRLKYQSPPYFLNPVLAAWQIATWIECKGTTGTMPTTCQ